MVLSSNGQWLLAVNAGSDETSVVSDRGERIAFTYRVASGGTFPVSVTIRGSPVYVLDAGVPNNVSGFTLSRSGRLTAPLGSTLPLSAASTAPAQVEFSAGCDWLVVTETVTNRIPASPFSRTGGWVTCRRRVLRARPPSASLSASPLLPSAGRLRRRACPVGSRDRA